MYCYLEVWLVDDNGMLVHSSKNVWVIFQAYAVSCNLSRSHLYFTLKTTKNKYASFIDYMLTRVTYILSKLFVIKPSFKYVFLSFSYFSRDFSLQWLPFKPAWAMVLWSSDTRLRPSVVRQLTICFTTGILLTFTAMILISNEFHAKFCSPWQPNGNILKGFLSKTTCPIWK